jgi:alkyl hydroperoxide reductase subunit AhpC
VSVRHTFYIDGSVSVRHTFFINGSVSVRHTFYIDGSVSVRHTLCTLDTIHRLFFVTRLIINKINKVQWVDFKLENVLVSLHSLKTMGLGIMESLDNRFTSQVDF